VTESKDVDLLRGQSLEKRCHEAICVEEALSVIYPAIPSLILVSVSHRLKRGNILRAANERRDFV
jgi:hypothetical protein